MRGSTIRFAKFSPGNVEPLGERCASVRVAPVAGSRSITRGRGSRSSRTRIAGASRSPARALPGARDWLLRYQTPGMKNSNSVRFAAASDTSEKRDENPTSPSPAASTVTVRCTAKPPDAAAENLSATRKRLPRADTTVPSAALAATDA